MEVPGLCGDSEDSSLHDATAIHTVQGNLVSTQYIMLQHSINSSSHFIISMIIACCELSFLFVTRYFGTPFSLLFLFRTQFSYPISPICKKLRFEHFC